MDQAVHAPDYPRDLKADWLVGLRAEIIEPIRARAVAHPFIADLCWTVITPGVVASLAARTPHYEHEIKTKLLENAYTKWNHAWALSQTVNTLGGPGDRIFNGPGTAWDALSYAWHLRNWQLLYAYHQPWPEGSAAFAVGIEDEALEWPVWHGGEVECSEATTACSSWNRKSPPTTVLCRRSCARGSTRPCWCRASTGSIATTGRTSSRRRPPPDAPLETTPSA